MQMWDVGFGVVLLAVFFDIWYKDYRGRRIERLLCECGDSIGAELERFELDIRTDIRQLCNDIQNDIKELDRKEFNRTLDHPPTPPIQ